MGGDNRDFNIAPKPQWSFGEVVEHAWQAYVGRGIESGGRRNVLFRVWAAMVGATRAVPELDHYIQKHGGVKGAAEGMGCSESTVQSLRRQFALVDENPLSPVPLALASGEQIRGTDSIYEVEDRLGSGGMAVVYRVHAIKSGDRFAAKLLSSERFAITNAVRDRFAREATLARDFSSPRVVRSIEVVHHRGSLVLIMELLSGRTLYDALREPRSEATPRQRVEWLSEITEGLAYLHEREIVHRDLSPRNCLFREDGTLAIGDFGVARRIDDQTLTTFHERMGSLIYISPQQRENTHSAKFTDDVFALGQTAYHLLTGRSPHGGIESIAELGYPAALDVCVRKCREPDASRRPRTATECLLALENLRIEDGSLPQSLSDIVV